MRVRTFEASGASNDQGSNVNVGMDTLQAGDRVPMSWEANEGLGPDFRGEYVDGCLVVSAAPSLPNQRICRRPANLLESAIPDAYEVVEGWAWKPTKDEFVPDVTVFERTPETIRSTASPLLAVEVLSTDRASDLLRKFAKYAAAGLVHYWVVDPERPEIMIYRLSDQGLYREIGRIEGAEEREIDLGVVQISVSPSHLLV